MTMISARLESNAIPDNMQDIPFLTVYYLEASLRLLASRIPPKDCDVLKTFCCVEKLVAFRGRQGVRFFTKTLKIRRDR